MPVAGRSLFKCAVTARKLVLPLFVRLALAMTSTASNNEMPRTFYQRPLPESCVALTSKPGRALFASALQHGGLKSYHHLIQQFTTQSEPAYCGISTLVVALNAFSIDPRRVWKGPWRWYEESMLNCCVNLEEAKATGINLQVFSCLAVCQGLESHVTRADDSDTIEDFRRAVYQACVEGDNDPEQLQHVLVTSYTRRVLGQTGDGHFSPVAAYDVASDMVLVLDVARFKYAAHFVPLTLLYAAMQPCDPDTGRPRGYVMLSNPASWLPTAGAIDRPGGDLPISLLFRSKLLDNNVRCAYHDFLANGGGEPSWDDVVEYWTHDGGRSIWGMMVPGVMPQENACETALIMRVIDRIDSLLPSSVPGLSPDAPPSDHCCRVPLKAQHALFLVYLASLSEVRRRGIVVKDENADEATSEQLLSEAELIAISLRISPDIANGLEQSHT